MVLYIQETLVGGKTTTRLQHFNFQLTHTTLKNVELLKHFKISKTAVSVYKETIIREP